MPTITVGGLPGSGKSTLARLLADEIGMDYISAGKIFRKMAADSGLGLEEFSRKAENDHEIDRKVDAYQVEQARGKNVVVDSRLSAWLLGKADLRVSLIADRRTRAQRVARRDEISEEEAINRVGEREQSEKRRYLEVYDIDISDMSVYDLVINSGTYLPREIVDIVCHALEISMSGKEKD